MAKINLKLGFFLFSIMDISPYPVAKAVYKYEI